MHNNDWYNKSINDIYIIIIHNPINDIWFDFNNLPPINSNYGLWQLINISIVKDILDP